MIDVITSIMRHRPKSIVWLHDGIYVHKETDPEHTMKLFTQKVREAGLVKVKVRRENLQEEYDKEVAVYRQGEGFSHDYRREQADYDELFEEARRNQGIVGETGKVRRLGMRIPTVDMHKPYREPPKGKK